LIRLVPKLEKACHGFLVLSADDTDFTDYHKKNESVKSVKSVTITTIMDQVY
jgi:hypothetical protein